MKRKLPALLLLLAGALPVLAQEDAQRIQFQKGKSSAEIRGTVHIQEGEPKSQTYLLKASAGQRMTVHFTSPEPEATYAVACPRGGSTGAGASPWTFELPESGDYRITVSGPYEAEKSFPYTLEVGVEGKPHPVEPKGLTGTYDFVDDPYNTIEILQLPDGRLRFYLLAFWKGDNWQEYGPNIGEASGVVKLEKNRAVYQKEGCVLAMAFAGDIVTIDQKGDCGFGLNVRASGTYRRASLCAAPRKE